MQEKLENNKTCLGCFCHKFFLLFSSCNCWLNGSDERHFAQRMAKYDRNCFILRQYLSNRSPTDEFVLDYEHLLHSSTDSRKILCSLLESENKKQCQNHQNCVRLYFTVCHHIQYSKVHGIYCEVKSDSYRLWPARSVMEQLVQGRRYTSYWFTN